MVIPCGFLNLAEMPVAFEEPVAPGEPASVVTAPVDFNILRIVRLLVSAI